MKLAVASGKGGTGKTSVTVALALASTRPTCILDCDVEEPNVGLFMPGQPVRVETVGLPVPKIDEQKCTGCGECREFCQFNALVCIGGKAMSFPELCHGCGGCMKVCPDDAISEEHHRIGTVEISKTANVDIVTGRLDVGQPMAPPVIRAVKRLAPGAELTIIDAPPGTACSMTAAVGDADFVLLVTEPTPFGLHDLRLAVETVRQMEKAFGVVVNRADSGDDKVVGYCRQEDIPVLLEIPDRREIAEAYSRGKGILEALPELRGDLVNLLRKLSA